MLHLQMRQQRHSDSRRRIQLEAASNGLQRIGIMECAGSREAEEDDVSMPPLITCKRQRTATEPRATA